MQQPAETPPFQFSEQGRQRSCMQQPLASAALEEPAAHGVNIMFAAPTAANVGHHEDDCERLINNCIVCAKYANTLSD